MSNIDSVLMAISIITTILIIGNHYETASFAFELASNESLISLTPRFYVFTAAVAIVVFRSVQ